MKILVLSENPIQTNGMLEELYPAPAYNFCLAEFRRADRSPLSELLLEDVEMILFDAPLDLDFVWLAQLRKATTVPIFLLAGASSEQALIDAYLAGVDDHLAKPVSPALLQAKLQVWQRRRVRVDVVN
jgi:DNA-binding response OmpR family regulator